MKVPLLDLKAHLEPIRSEILAAITDVVDSTQYILGPKVIELEKKIADYCNVKQAIGVSSGTDALLISLMSLNIKPGDIIITTPYSFFATAGVIARFNARPVFVDIDPVTYNLDPQKLTETLETGTTGAISCQIFDISKVKAIIPVHLYGQCANMQKITALGTAYSIPIIEDAAQAIGAEYPVNDNIKKVGSIGYMGCFSFFPSKNLGCMGDGGMISTNDDVLADRLRVLRVHGGKPKYYHKIIGGNFRLDPMQAAIIMVKFPFLNQWHNARQRNSLIYDRLFKESGLSKNRTVITPKRVYSSQNSKMEYDHIFNQYVIRVNDRDKIREFLKDKGIGTEIYYPVPFHLQECFTYLGYKIGDFPESEKAANETLALPIYPELTIDQQEYVVGCIKDFFSL